MNSLTRYKYKFTAILQDENGYEEGETVTIDLVSTGGEAAHAMVIDALPPVPKPEPGDEPKSWYVLVLSIKELPS